ncbi:hypothetical protein [Enterobacter roggenkampii]|uniref:hypothetical protein n=1 Tax=Enterobacter roggenkampii TaxID=1812935 RepID=UPI002DB5E57A|nr:hypothetical protein [Enterobacter roggenkampii]MEB5889991.1 hypothetical protein [Enterobacter roggenkampii]
MMTDTVKPGEGPVQTDALKEKFRARSIPLEKDFHDLIDMADAGRLAAGLSPAQDGTKDNPQTGLIVDANKRLAVKAATDGGLKVDNSGVGVNPDDTLQVNNGKLGVADKYVKKTGDSSITDGDLSFASDDKGIHFFGGGRITKKFGAGVYWYRDTDGRLPSICNNDGSNPSSIATEAYVDSVKPGAMPKGGLYSDAHGLGIKLNPDGGLRITTDGALDTAPSLIHRILAAQLGGINLFGETDKFFVLGRFGGHMVTVFAFGKGTWVPVDYTVTANATTQFCLLYGWSVITRTTTSLSKPGEYPLYELFVSSSHDYKDVSSPDFKVGMNLIKWDGSTTLGTPIYETVALVPVQF